MVVSTPGEAYFDVSTHEAGNIPELADRERTRQQHDLLKSTMAASGCEVIDVPELAKHPNSAFPRDVALCTPEGYIKLRMGLEARRGEEEWISRALQAIGEPFVGEITGPATAEGGDVILAGSVAFVGLSHRTNQAGVDQLTDLLRAMGYEVRTASVKDRYMHLGGGMSAIGPERFLCCRGVFPEEFFKGFDTIEVEPQGPSTGNVICLDHNEVIANAAENAPVIRELAVRGVTVHGINLSEFRKGAGGPTCLILPVERK
ncbi:MAG: amidinotransferase [Gemmatimonadales bacterium]|nr:amidinotransferase [Gemmatimonadales bacterium]NIN12162.1 amidinotransferase [Gemmatimonadales bacterium]NIN50583.1 amidinotransferase [Gemmatimonadales bacterium]NIP08047.1 amidinotransferase [Gemmatimonadales bacterium]NIR00629.1 amidinotransferase [Gemmatimonadales bacterium]